MPTKVEEQEIGAGAGLEAAGKDNRRVDLVVGAGGAGAVADAGEAHARVSEAAVHCCAGPAGERLPWRRGLWGWVTRGDVL